MSIELVLLIVILLAGFYMAWNIGANDVANAVGTSVGSGALTLKQAVMMAAVLEFAGAFFFGSHVTETVQKGIVDSDIFMQNPLILVYGMLAALLAAGSWLQIASYFGWPVSTTHSIVGAVIGFGAVVGGWEAIYWNNVAFIVSSWILSPLIGGAVSFFIFTLLRRRIFNTFHPLEEAKRMAPILGFLLVSSLSLVMLFKGLTNIGVDLNFVQSTLFSALLGLIAAVIIYFAVKRITINPDKPKSQTAYGPEIALGLEKAQKHLRRVKQSAVGDMQYHVSILLDEVDNLSSNVKQNIQEEVSNSEYTAVEKVFATLQLFSASLMAFGHGANDVANAIGPLAAAIQILMTGTIPATSAIPTWTLALGGVGIIIGLATWGWRVIETIGKKITELTPTRGFAAEFGAAMTILVASRLGMPISTTHTLVGAVIGIGLARGIEALDLTTTRDIVISWIITVPAGAIIAVGFFYVIQSVFGHATLGAW